MKKEEIIKLTKLQSQIDDVTKKIRGCEKSISISTCDGTIYRAGLYEDIFDHIQSVLLNDLEELQQSLVAEREKLILCTGQTDYKPINILD